MKTNLAADFSVNKDNNSITIQREFAAGPALVWDAFTKSEILDRWWAPRPWKTRTKNMDFREGGHWLYAMVGPEGEEHWALLNYKRIVPQQKFTGTDAFADAEGKINKNMPQSDWEVNFSHKGDNTMVEFHIAYADLAQLEATIKMGFKEGITMTLDYLQNELLPALKK